MRNTTIKRNLSEAMVAASQKWSSDRLWPRSVEREVDAVQYLSR